MIFHKILFLGFFSILYLCFQIETSLPTIPTFSRNLDNILGTDGIQLGSLTELLGLSGSGKTQLWFVI